MTDRYQNLIETIRDPVFVITTEGFISTLNSAFERITGWPREAWLGQHFSKMVYPEDLLRAYTYFELALQGGTNPMFEMRLANRAGEYWTAEIVMSQQLEGDVVTGFLGTARDISERKRAEEQLRQSEERYRLIVDTAQEGIWIRDKDARTTFVNRRMAEMLGYTPDEMMGRLVFDFVSDGQQERTQSNIQRRREGIDEHFDFRFRCKDGSEIWTMVSTKSLFGDDGQFIGALGMVSDITDRKRAEDQLRESEALKAGILEAALDAIVTFDHEGRIVEFNRAAEHMFGFSYDYVLGKTLAETILPASEARRAQENHSQFIASNIEAMLGQRVETRARRADGSEFPVELAITALHTQIPPLLTAYLRDLTELKRAEEENRQSQQRFRAAFDYAAIGMALVSLDGRWLEVNRALLDIVGYNEDELLASSFQAITHPDDLDEDLGHTARLLRGEIRSYQMEKRYRHKERHYVWALLSVSLVSNSDGRPSYYISQIEDISARKRAESEVAAALVAQRAANQQLSNLNKAKSDFLSVLSHEFRTPLATIQGFSELIRDEDTDADARQQFGAEIHKAALRLTAMINEILDLDRMESGRMLLHKDWFDINLIISEEVETARPNAPKHPILLQLDQELPLVLADGIKLSRVVTNLLSNAIKYSPGGGAILVRSWIDGSLIHVSVQDRGIGIPPDSLDKIFERYTRVESSATRLIQGTGLGLPIVRQIIEMHGGRVWAQSTVGKGSTFHLTIPLDDELRD